MAPESITLPPSGEFPNSPALPVLVYCQAFAGEAASASAIKKRFADNGWGGLWRNGLYAFHHYHSRGHEALGVCQGWVRVQLGGESGEIFRLDAGDAIVLPAGVAHKQIEASSDFSVVGAYPPGQWPDMNTGQPGERAAAENIIAALAHPATDPVEGPSGPLPELYAQAAKKETPWRRTGCASTASTQPRRSVRPRSPKWAASVVAETGAAITSRRS